MKIAFADDLIHAYALGDPGAVGGAERQQWLLARALAASDWSVVVGIRKRLQPGERKIIQGVEFVGIGQKHSLLAWRRFLFSERPDWWYRRTADHLLGPAVEISKLTGVKTIFSAGFDSDVQPRRALSRRHRWWPLYAWGLKRTDKIFLQHEDQLSSLPLCLRSKSFIVPSIASVSTSIKPHVERRRYIAWVAMLREPKRPDLLVEIARKAPDLPFLVCGEATAHRSSPGYGKQIIADLRSTPNVEYRGRVSPEQARQIIADAAVFLLTSAEEGFPNTFLEAWSSGTPVVSLGVDPAKVLSRNKIGLVVGTTEGAIQNLRRLISSPDERQELAVRSKRYVSHVHSANTVMEAFHEAVYSNGNQADRA
jgi:glycosyltransferase involved in cell wall biosynthesis